jgi:hypothetical protein
MHRAPRTVSKLISACSQSRRAIAPIVTKCQEQARDREIPAANLRLLRDGDVEAGADAKHGEAPPCSHNLRPRTGGQHGNAEIDGQDYIGQQHSPRLIRCGYREEHCNDEQEQHHTKAALVSGSLALTA